MCIRDSLSSVGAQTYLDQNAFGNSVLLEYDQFNHPFYSQYNALQFIPGLSSLDILFNLGRLQSREILFSRGTK